jgi:hypothetical protein
VIRAGRADRGGGDGGGQGEHRMGLGDGGPGARSGRAVALAEQSARLSGKFLGAAGNAVVRSLMLRVVSSSGSGVIPRTLPGELPRACPPRRWVRIRAGG